MSGQDANFMTHDSLGKEPRNGLVKFKVEWKNSGDASTRENAAGDGKPGVTIINIDPQGKYDWDSFKYLLPRGDADPQIIYTDSDGDEIPIESQCEFEEALRFAQDRAKRLRNVHLILKKQSKSETTKKDIEIQPNIQTISNETNNTMPPMKLDDGGQDYRRIPPSSEINCVVTQPGRSNDERAPKWFTAYMQTMKEEIISEVSTRVTKTVIDALQKKQSSQYDSAISHPRTAVTECLGDSDSDEDVSAHYSTRPSSDVISTEDIPCHKRNAKGPSRSGTHRCDSSSPHRYRSNEKKRRKHKGEVSHASKLERHYISPSFKHRQDEKTAMKKRDDEDEIPLAQGSGNFERERISVAKRLRECENRDEEIDTPYRRMIASGLGVKSVTTIDSDNLFDAPIVKLCPVMLSNGQKIETISLEEAVLTDCSVIGNDILDRPNDRVHEYCALSDSDNISIISDVSHISDMQRISNRFEMILQPCVNYDDEDNDGPVIATEMMEKQRQKNVSDYCDNARDSSSFELLSEPPSPPLSIHMDEDHFSHGRNKTNDYNINDDMPMDKRGNQNKIEVCPLAIDKQGKIYRHNIIEPDEEFLITLENRTDGAYSFVAETLPGPTRESILLTGRYDSSTNETNTALNGVDNEIPMTQIPNGTSPDGSSSSDAFHDSTQSFHSHTTPQTENERRDFTGYPSTTGNDENTGTATRSRVFVDHNASKGLGDTRQSSPKKQSTISSRSGECFFSIAEPRTGKPSSRDPGQGSSRRNANTRLGDRSNEFNRPTPRNTKMMNDLPMNDFDNNSDPIGRCREFSSPEAALSSSNPRSSSPEPSELPLAFVDQNVDKILRLKTKKVADKPNFSRVMY